MLANNVFDVVDHVAAHLADRIDGFAAAGASMGEQIIDGVTEAGEVGLDVVEHFAAGIAGEAFDLLRKLQHVFAEALQVLLQIFHVDRRAVAGTRHESTPDRANAFLVGWETLERPKWLPAATS